MGLLTTLRTKAAALLTPVSSAMYTAWSFVVRESFTGAWQRNVTVQRDNVLAYWAVYACIRQIAGDIAKMRLKLVELGENDIWTEVRKASPFLGLLRKPNRFQTRFQFFVHWYVSLLIHGNTYALKQRDDRNMVKALYILDPTGVTVLVGEDGSIFYQLRRDNLNGRGDMLDVTVPASEIIHDRAICLFHPLVGVSPLYACGVAATQGLSIQNNSANFFANGSMPGGIIKVPGQLTKEKAEAMKALWDTGFSGDNRGKTAILADKMEFQAMTMSAHDAQLIEQLRMTAEMVCACFGMPTYKVGVAPAPANSNVAAQDQNYYSQTLQPLIEGTEAVLDEGLGLGDANDRTPGSLGVEFDLEALIRMDPMAQIEFAEKAVKSSVMSPNEARKRFDLAPVKGGESPMLQQQNYSLAALAKRDARENPFVAATPPPAAPPAPASPEGDGESPIDEAAVKRVVIESLEPFAAEVRGLLSRMSVPALPDPAEKEITTDLVAEFEAELGELIDREFGGG